MKVAIEPVYDRFGGMYAYVSGIKRYSSGTVREVPPRFMRSLLCRNRRLNVLYKRALAGRGLRTFDVVHSMSDPWFMEVCRSSRGGWVHTYHIMFFEEDYLDGLAEWQEETNRYQVEVASNADVRITTSRWMHEYLLKEHSIDTEIVMGGIDVDLCGKARPEMFRGICPAEDFVLFVGSCREVKNPSMFLDLAIRMPHVTFVMIGPGLDEKSIRCRFGCAPPRNMYALGRMPRHMVLNTMAACRVYVLTSRHEGFPQSVLEAMALGKPVVISDYRGSDEIVTGNDKGYIYDMFSADDLKDKVAEAFEDKSVGHAARKWVSENLDWRVLTPRIDELYSKAAARV